jgi:hypothetical protein
MVWLGLCSVLTLAVKTRVDEVILPMAPRLHRNDREPVSQRAKPDAHSEKITECQFGKVTSGQTKQSNEQSNKARIARNYGEASRNHNPRVGGSSPSSGISVSIRVTRASRAFFQAVSARACHLPESTERTTIGPEAG